MNLHTLILTQNDCYKAGSYIKPSGIMVHSTGANNPNLRRYVGPDDGLLGVNQYGNHWNQGGIDKCVHAFIGRLADGSVAVYQTLPWDMRGWHAGGDANNTHISFEICEDALTDAIYFAAVYQAAVELCAMLCKQYGLDPLADGVLIDHAEGHARGIASDHGDVAYWFRRHGKSMDIMRQEVRKEMDNNPVLDNTPDDYAKGAVQRAVEAAILRGNERGDLMLHSPVTRQDLCVILDRCRVI